MRLDGREQLDSLWYMGVLEPGQEEVEMRRRIQPSVNSLRKGEEVIADIMMKANEYPETMCCANIYVWP